MIAIASVVGVIMSATVVVPFSNSVGISPDPSPLPIVAGGSISIIEVVISRVISVLESFTLIDASFVTEVFVGEGEVEGCKDTIDIVDSVDAI